MEQAHRKVLILSVLLCCSATFLVYFPSLENEFTNWDDQEYVTENVRIQDMDIVDLKDHFVGYFDGNYHPLTMIAYTLEYRWFGLNPLPYHLVNVLIHVLNVFLVFVLIVRLFRDVLAASITALLFGIHPMHVESVAWISELKDVLYCLFFLLSLIAYQFYVGPDPRRWGFYVVSVLTFVLSVLSKGMAVTLPLVLLVIDYLRGRPWKRDAVLDKLVFFGIAIVFGIVAIHAQSASGSVHSMDSIRWFERVLVAFYGLGIYLYKVLLPIDLACFYPYPQKQNGWLPAHYYLMPAVILFLGFLITRSRKSGRTLIGLSLFFLFSIGTVLQLLPVGDAVAADRYTYVPYIGVFALIGLAISFASGRRDALDAGHSRWLQGIVRFRGVLLALFGVYVAAMGILAWQRTLVWKDSETLWTDAVNKYPVQTIGYNNRGQHYIKAGRFDLALRDFNQAIAVDPRFPNAYNNRGNVHVHEGDVEAAIADYTMAIRLAPSYPGAHGNRGRARIMLGRYQEAKADLDRAIELNPSDVNGRINRAIALKKLGDLQGAIAEYDILIRMYPDEPTPYYNRALSWMAMGDHERAILDLNVCLGLDPGFARAYAMRSRVYHGMNMNTQALDDLLQAERLGVRIDQDYLRSLRE